jgi:hypothetical protein
MPRPKQNQKPFPLRSSQPKRKPLTNSNGEEAFQGAAFESAMAVDQDDLLPLLYARFPPPRLRSSIVDNIT